MSKRQLPRLGLLCVVIACCPPVHAAAKDGELPVRETEFVGGDGGGAFRVLPINSKVSAEARVTRIVFLIGDYVERVHCHVEIDDQSWESPLFGRKLGPEPGSKEYTFTMMDGEHLVSIDVATIEFGKNKAQVPCRLVVQTNERSVEIGQEGRGEFVGTVRAPKGARVVGICGRAGTHVDSLGFQYVEAAQERKEE